MTASHREPARVSAFSLRVWVAILALALSVACGTQSPESTPPPSPQSVVLLTGPSTGSYSPLGQALADVYNARLSSVRVVATPTEGPEGAASNAQALEAGKADLAFSRADLAFQVSRQAEDESSGNGGHLRSIAVMYTNAVHLLVRRGSGIKRGEDMRGHRVQVRDEAGGGTMAQTIIEAHGISMSELQAVGNARNALARLKSGELDVRIFASAYPLASVGDVGESSGVALLPLSPPVIDRLRSRSPYFKPAVIPKGTYKGQEDDVVTVGIDGLLLCRDTMPEAVVYDLTRTLFEALPELARTHSTARLINEGNAPATPVPLHPGAARYYRERDLFR